MALRLQVNRILRGDFTVEAKLRQNKATCCDGRGKPTSALKKWRDEAKSNTLNFLETQFEKKLENFDRLDWRLVKQNCIQFLPKDKQSAINNKPPGRTSKQFILDLQGTQTHNVLSESEAVALLTKLFKKHPSELTYHQKLNLVNNVDILSQLSPKFIAKYNLYPQPTSVKQTPAKKPTILDYLKQLPDNVTPERLDQTLLSLPLRKGKGSVDPVSGKVSFDKNVWRKLIEIRDQLPETMKLRYAKELRFLKAKTGPKPKEKPEQPLKPSLRTGQKPPKPERVTNPIKRAVVPVRKTDVDDIDDLLDDNKSKKPAPVLTKPEDTGMLMNENDVVKFINKQANKALLPDESPRMITTPKSMWSTPDWALVDVYRDRIYPKFLEDNRDYINNALKRIGKIVGANVKSVVMNKPMALAMIAFYKTFSQGENYA